MALQIGDTAPNFDAETTEGNINFYDWAGDSWVVIFSHPKDFTPVCTTELGAMAGIADQFAARNTKIIGLSVDSVDDHQRWKKDIADATGNAVNYPMIGDTEMTVAKLFGMIHPNATGKAADRTAADNKTVRTVFVIGPDREVKLTLAYPMSTGRNFDEILRVLDSIQLTAKHKVATPVNWQNGDDVIIVPAMSDAEAKEEISRKAGSLQSPISDWLASQKTDPHKINLLIGRSDPRAWPFSVGGLVFSQLGSLQYIHIQTGGLRLETSSQSGFTFCPNGHGDST